MQDGEEEAAQFHGHCQAGESAIATPSSPHLSFPFPAELALSSTRIEIPPPEQFFDASQPSRSEPLSPLPSRPLSLVPPP